MSPINEAIKAARESAYLKNTEPTNGHFIALPNLHPKLPKWTRITHSWDDHVQTGIHGSYYLSSGGGMSFSGSLNPGIATKELISTKSTRMGTCWFPDEGHLRAGCAIHTEIPCRIWEIRPDADISGLWELHTPFTLNVLDEAQHKNTCGYWYCIQESGMSSRAFKKEGQLLEWLRETGLKLTKALTPAGTPSYQRLAYT